MNHLFKWLLKKHWFIQKLNMLTESVTQLFCSKTLIHSERKCYGLLVHPKSPTYPHSIFPTVMETNLYDSAVDCIYCRDAEIRSAWFSCFGLFFSHWSVWGWMSALDIVSNNTTTGPLNSALYEGKSGEFRHGLCAEI